jgi:hypothetical protein
MDIYKRNNAVFAYEYKCGHYRLNNGRHRICLAAKLDISIKIDIKKLSGLCDACKSGDESILETL